MTDNKYQNAIQDVFLDGKTYYNFQDKKITQDLLHKLYDMVKMTPTSANTQPLRIYFIESEEMKKKLIPCVDNSNQDKVNKAPVTAILAFDTQFYNEMDYTFIKDHPLNKFFATNEEASKETAFRNSSIQIGAFFIACRLLGLQAGPMSGFDNKAIDEQFLKNTKLKSNVLCNIGYGIDMENYKRLPRLDFSKACKII